MKLIPRNVLDQRPYIKAGAVLKQYPGGAAIGQYPQAGNDIERFVRERSSGIAAITARLSDCCQTAGGALITERHTSSGGTVGIRTDITALKEALVQVAVANERVSSGHWRRAVTECGTDGTAISLCVPRHCCSRRPWNNMSQGLLMVGFFPQTHRVQQPIPRDIPNNRDPTVSQVSQRLHSPPIESGGGPKSRCVRKIYRRRISRRRNGWGCSVTIDDDPPRWPFPSAPCPTAAGSQPYEELTTSTAYRGSHLPPAHHDTLILSLNRPSFTDRTDEMLGHLTNDGGRLVLPTSTWQVQIRERYPRTPCGDTLLEFCCATRAGCVPDSICPTWRR